MPTLRTSILSGAISMVVIPALALDLGIRVDVEPPKIPVPEPPRLPLPEPVKIIKKAGENFVEQRKKEIDNGVEQAKAEADNAIKQVRENVDDVVSTIDQAKKQTVDQAITDLKWNVDKALEDAKNTARKAADDTASNTAKAANDLVDAGKASARFVQRQIEGYKESLSNADRRIREGKVGDALWHLSTDPVGNTSDAAARAAAESPLIAAAMSTAATAYGGPAGGAAYSAWLAYEQTKDPMIALRVGVQAGLQSAAIPSAASLPAGTAGELTKKAVITGAIGGIAVAAAGGDADAVREAFVKQGGMVIVQAGQSYVAGKMADIGAEVDAYCVSSIGAQCRPAFDAIKIQPDGKVVLDEKGLPLVDKTRVDAARQALGGWKDTATSVDYKVPGIDGVALGSDWVVSWDKTALTSKAANLPGVALNYVGPNSPYERKVREVEAILRNGPDPTMVGATKTAQLPTALRTQHWVEIQNPEGSELYFDRVTPAPNVRPIGVGDVVISNRVVRARTFDDKWNDASPMPKGATVHILEIRQLAETDKAGHFTWARIEPQT